MKAVKRFTSWPAMRLMEHPARRAIIELCGLAPRSIQDLSRALELNPGSVHNHVHRLADAGYLEIVATREVHGIVEKKYACVAKRFDFSRVARADRPARNRFIARDLGREVQALLDHDPKAMATRLVAMLSDPHAAHVRALLTEIGAYVTRHEHSGDVPFGYVAAFGKRDPDAKP